MINQKLTHHLTRLLLGIAIALLLGWWLEQLVLISGLFLVAYLAWQVYNSFRLYRWLQHSDTEVPESLGLWADIFGRIATVQKQNRKKNRQYQQVIDDFEDMADAFPDATLTIDSNGIISWFNDSAVNLLSLQTRVDRGQAVTNLIRDPAFADWLTIQDKLQSTLEITCPGNNNVTLQISAVRLRESQRLLILRDITDVQDFDRMRHDLVANVSHELRTPLTVLLGYLEILKSQPDEANPDAIKRMFEQARQMNELIKDLLELSRLQDTENPEGYMEVDIPAMMVQLAEQAEDLGQGQYNLNFKIEPGLKMYGVEADLKSAFQNLVVNAINYTPEKGSIRITWQETDEGLVLGVIDNGVGIPTQDLPRITERFYRVGDDRNRNTGGTGLGLAIVKHVLNSHGAKLEVKSEPGNGSEFHCIFPSESKA